MKQKGHSIRQSGFFEIFVIFAVLLVFVAGGYYFWTHKTLLPVPNATVALPLPSLSTAVDETANTNSIGANWKTYTSNKFGIEFKYPTEFAILEENNKLVELGIKDKISVSISLGHSGNYKTLPYCDNTRTSYSQPYKYPCLGQGVIIGANNDPLEESLNNSESEVFILNTDSTKSNDILQITNPQKMEITFSEADISIEVVRKIISTFKFTK